MFLCIHEIEGGLVGPLDSLCLLGQMFKPQCRTFGRGAEALRFPFSTMIERMSGVLQEERYRLRAID